jgi:lipoate-protein ligase A
MERFFREINRGARKRNGGKTLGHVLTTMLADTPLIKNLENKKYEKIILSGCAILAERFAEIEAKEVREKLKQAMQRDDKLHPAVKRLMV